MSTDADVLVIGGGLAGSTTALLLARAGKSVIVIEKASFPRDKPCGEGLLPHGVEKLTALGFGPALDEARAQPFVGIRYRCHGARADGDFAEGARGRGVRRRLLDDAVQQRAIAEGARKVKATARAFETGDQGARVTLDDGRELRARLLVGADGPRSKVRHALGLDGGAPTDGRYAVRQHFSLAPGIPLPDRVEVSALSGFELYLTPVEPGVVGVAALCERRVMQAGDGKPAARLAALLASAPDAVKERLAGSTPAGDAMACGPLRVKAKRVWGQSALLVGDAAGYVDAITGEGMSLALGSAELAASALGDVLDGHASERQAFERYAKGRAAIFRDHALLTHGLVFLARRPFLVRRAIGRLAHEPALFTRLLSVNDGRRTFFSLGVSDLVKLGVGKRPPPQAAERLLPEPSGTKRGLPPMASA